MRNVIQLFLAADTILLMRKWNHAFFPSCDRSCVKMADRFASRSYSLNKRKKMSKKKISLPV